jgi:hypothetical protein
VPRAPFDWEAALAKLERADEQLATAGAEASATIERVQRALRESPSLGGDRQHRGFSSKAAGGSALRAGAGSSETI